jgi:hypothetical protein
MKSVRYVRAGEQLGAIDAFLKRTGMFSLSDFHHRYNVYSVGLAGTAEPALRFS